MLVKPELGMTMETAPRVDETRMDRTNVIENLLAHGVTSHFANDCGATLAGLEKAQRYQATRTWPREIASRTKDRKYPPMTPEAFIRELDDQVRVAIDRI